MHDHRFHQKPDRESSPGGPRFSHDECRRIFRRMVSDEISTGRLGYLRRRQLLDFAPRLGLTSFEAHLILHEVEKSEPTAEHASALRFESPADLKTLLSPESWPVWFKMSLVIVTAAIIDFLLIRYVIQ